MISEEYAVEYNVLLREPAICAILVSPTLIWVGSFGGIMEVDTRTYKVTREIKIGQRRRVIAMALVPTHFIGSTVWVVCGLNVCAQVTRKVILPDICVHYGWHTGCGACQIIFST